MNLHFEVFHITLHCPILKYNCSKSVVAYMYLVCAIDYRVFFICVLFSVPTCIVFISNRNFTPQQPNKFNEELVLVSVRRGHVIPDSGRASNVTKSNDRRETHVNAPFHVFTMTNSISSFTGAALQPTRILQSGAPTSSPRLKPFRGTRPWELSCKGLFRMTLWKKESINLTMTSSSVFHGASVALSWMCDVLSTDLSSLRTQLLSLVVCTETFRQFCWILSTQLPGWLGQCL